jgi:hypothetical protein
MGLVQYDSSDEEEDVRTEDSPAVRNPSIKKIDNEQRTQMSANTS